MVLHTRKIFYSSSSYKHHAMLLKCVLFSWDICDYFCSVRKSYLSNLSLSRVRFLRSNYGNLDAYTSFERCWYINATISFEGIDPKLQSRSLWLSYVWLSSFLNKLCNCRHSTISVGKKRNGLYSPLTGMIQVLFLVNVGMYITLTLDYKWKISGFMLHNMPILL